MAISPYRASTDLFRPLLEDFLGPTGDGNRLRNMMRAPAADVVERENEIRVIVEMPGVNPDAIQVDIENNLLTVSGEKQEDRTEGDEQRTWHLTQRRYGQFSRAFVLPRDVDAEGIRADFENGILTIGIPKSERARRRRIDVNSSTAQQQVETGTR